MNKRYAAVGTTAALVLAGLTGCTTQQAKDTAKSVADTAGKTNSAMMAALARTSEKTERAKSATITATVSGTGQPKPVTMTGTYTWGAREAFDTRMDTASAGIADLNSQPTTRMLFVDGAYFYQIDPQSSGPLKGKHWMKVEASAVFGKKGAAEMSRTDGDPTAGLKFLKNARDADDLGTETVRGKSAHHYVLHVGRDQWGAAGDALTGRDKDSRMGEYTGDVKEITLGIWVDPRTDLPVRMEETIGAARISVDFRSFGGAQTISAPPAADTADVTDEVKAATADEATSGGASGSNEESFV
ncbi:hypothetical protein [Streptomyces melanogenes]|uniref:hypothetical protein n=1 Tax=Streptomyces melanogenes TaxID=67326 RepID=UPI00167DE2EF|nr:hypothetical protein [Streptomyces melanogenes]GGP78443.1 putative lipoprotein [Streptomyces melanogenes]